MEDGRVPALPYNVEQISPQFPNQKYQMFFKTETWEVSHSENISPNTKYNNNTRATWNI